MTFRVAFGKISFVWVKIHAKPYLRCIHKVFLGSPHLKIHGCAGYEGQKSAQGETLYV